VVTGVTSVFADVTAIPFKLSAPLPLDTLPTVVCSAKLCGERSIIKLIDLMRIFALKASQFDLSFHI
jgi:hypothetical protein